MISIFMLLTMIFSLAACGQVEGTSDTAPSEASTEAATQPDIQGESLIVYFSWSTSGNTEQMANVIKERTGGDILEIEPAVAYPTDHNELLQVAQEEIRQNARPEIDGTIEDFDSYDTVFVGYPNWNADMPYIMYTFFETYDFSGKTIVPFNTHGGRQEYFPK